MISSFKETEISEVVFLQIHEYYIYYGFFLFFLHISQSLLNVWILHCLKIKQFRKHFERCKMPLSLKKKLALKLSAFMFDRLKYRKMLFFCLYMVSIKRDENAFLAIKT